MVRGPESLRGWELALGEAELVAGLFGVEGLVGGVDEDAVVDGVGGGVAVETLARADVAVEVVALEEAAGSEELSAVGDLAGVDLLEDGFEVGLGVGDSVADGLLDLGRELVEVEGLVGTDVEAGEAGEQGGLGWVGRAELEDEVNDGKMSGDCLVMSAGGIQLTAGDTAGAGWWKKALRGWAWYSDWILLTLGRSAMLKSWVRKRR